jgi:DNA-binding CsgD family transcriptional regulator
VALRAGAYHEARDWCQQSFRIILHVGMRFNSARALLLAAVEVLAALGGYEQAAELVGWCKFNWGEKHFAALARWQTTTRLDRLESQLGTQVYTAAVTRGQSADPDGVIPALLDELNKLQPLAAESTSIAGVSRFPIESLTERELEILRLIAEGLSNQEIADRLFLSLGTIKWYTGQIYSKLGAQSRTQAVHWAQQMNLLS